MRRDLDFYRKDERDTLAKYYLEQHKNSGSGFLRKADGSDSRHIVEMKSTESGQFNVKLEDLARLDQIAKTENKLPVFLLKDLTNNQEYVMIKPELLKQVAKHFGEPSAPPLDVRLKVEPGKEKAKVNTERIVRGGARGYAKMLEEEREEKEKKGKRYMF